MLRPRPRLLVALAALPGCVLPAGGATGVEVTWSLREANTADGDDARRLRTCDGAGLDRVVLDVADVADPERRRQFPHGCTAGNPSPATRATEVPEIFLDLRAGEYALTATAEGPGAVPRAVAATAATVEQHAVLALDLELARPLQPVDLDLAPGPCDRVTADLRYADPTADLFLDDPDAPPATYRAALVSDRGLRLGGQDQACATIPAGLHRVSAVDPGRYVLHLAIDGRTCAVPVVVEDSPVRLALDLEKPACGG